MDFLECQDFFIPLSSTNFRDHASKAESIEIDEELITVNQINPDDFLNESFFKSEKSFTENEYTKRTKSSSESSFSDIMAHQLTPPISPQPIIIDGLKLIPITQIPHGTAIPAVRKIKPILPASCSKSHTASSDSDSNNPSNLGVVDTALTIKQARIIRNRESALQSRRKKKEYVQNLELEVGDLRKEVKRLRDENHLLKEKLKEFTSLTCRTAGSAFSKKNSSLYMCALLLCLVGFNLFNFIPSAGYLTKVNDMSSASITSRHLLQHFENNTFDIDESGSSENESIPLYFNQTDRVRKANIENVLNWIPQPDLFNASNQLNYVDIEDPLQYKLSRMYEKSRENQARKEKKPKRPFRKKLLKNEDVQNLYNPDSFKFMDFFEEIGRRDDTFYVLSFRGDHLLLPAERGSQMVKMNLIMPRGNETSSDKIQMMQIETIIVNTSLIEVTEKYIPNKLVKLNQESNSTAPILCNQQKAAENITKSAESIVTPKARGRFAPYFQFDLNARK